MSYIVYFYPKVASYYSNLVSLYLSTHRQVLSHIHIVIRIEENAFLFLCFA